MMFWSLYGYSTSRERALVYPSGRVLVGGLAVSGVTTVFPGDRLVTAPGATAALVSKGITTVIPSN
jgi:hypothetical protein